MRWGLVNRLGVVAFEGCGRDEMFGGNLHLPHGQLYQEEDVAGCGVGEGETRVCKMKGVNCDRRVSYNAIVQNCSVSLILDSVGPVPRSGIVHDIFQHHRKKKPCK